MNILSQQVATVSEVKTSDVYDYDTSKTVKKHTAKVTWQRDKYNQNFIEIDNEEHNLKYGDAVRIVISEVPKVEEPF